MRKIRTGVVFPSTDENIASYSPTSFCISLETITSRQLTEIFKPGVANLPGKKVVFHEMRHHIDHLSTLWGQRRILALYEAVNAKFSRTESEFHKMATYKIEEKQLRLLDYYMEVRGQADYRTPLDAWKWRITSGVKFDAKGNQDGNKTILFMRFTDPSEQMQLRTPITIASLLEVNAIYEETILERMKIAEIPSEEHREKAKEINNKLMMRTIIYNQNMWEYNCALHIVSNLLHINDVYEAYDIASSIATLVLNLDVNILDNLKVDKEYMAVWGDRPDNFIKDLNYGFLYFNLVNNYVETYSKSKKFDLTEFLAINGLPNEKEILDNTFIAMDTLQKSLNPKGYFNDFFSRQLSSGRTLLEMRGIDGKKQHLTEIVKSGQYAPFIVDKNSPIGTGPDFYSLINEGEQDGKRRQDLNPMEWYVFVHDIYSRITEFHNICGI